MKHLFLILISIQFLFSNENYFLLDSLDLDIENLLNYQKEAETIYNKTEKADFFRTMGNPPFSLIFLGIYFPNFFFYFL